MTGEGRVGEELVSGMWGKELKGGGVRRMGGGGEKGGAQKALRQPLDADKPLLSPAGKSLRPPTQQNKNRSPGGRALRDKSVGNVWRQIILARSE